MKPFEDFVEYLNSDKFQQTLNDIPLNLSNKEYNLLSPSDIAELQYATTEQTLNMMVHILGAYHEWIEN